MPFLAGRFQERDSPTRTAGRNANTVSAARDEEYEEERGQESPLGAVFSISRSGDDGRRLWHATRRIDIISLQATCYAH